MFEKQNRDFNSVDLMIVEDLLGEGIFSKFISF